MKTFFKTIGSYFVSLLLVIAAINLWYYIQDSRAESTMSIERTGNLQIKDVPDRIDVCNFGSSHGLSGFDYEDFSDFNCYNFGQGSQFPSYDYRIMQNYENHFYNGTIAYIPISHFSLFGIPEVEYPNFESLNKRYYKFLRNDLIKEYDPKMDFFITYLPAFSQKHIAEIVEVLFGISDGGIWQTSMDVSTADDHGYKRYITFVESKKSPDGSRLYNEEEIQAVYDMIRFCQAHGMRPILITTPFYVTYNNAVKENDPAFLDDFYGVIQKIVQDTGVEYYDYSEDLRFEKDPTLFCNTDHLNRIGARLFTRILLEETVGIIPAG